MKRNHLKKKDGYTLIELLVSMGIGLLLLGALTSTFISESKYFALQEQLNEMQQNARAATDVIMREVKVAGYHPTAATDGIPYSASQLQVLADFDGDGNNLDANEDITYSFDAANFRILRNAGSSQVLAENIQDFTFSYLDASGNSTTTTANIRQIQVSITARTSKADPTYATNGGYRTYQLTALITPPNLAY